jgi:hypothetical protein
MLLRRCINVEMQRGEHKTSVINNKCIHLPARVISRRSIYRAVRESLVCIIQTTPICLMNRAKYMVMRSLQLFVIYNYFSVEPI